MTNDPVDIRKHPEYARTEAPAPWANLDLVGQAQAERRLASLAAEGRIGGAWIIGGKAGIGKATLAFRLARFLLCGPGQDLFGEPPATLDVDPGDRAAQWISARSHGDLLVIEPGIGSQGRRRREVVVEDVRRLGPFFAQSAGNDGWRIAIIDQADLMNRNAANAALKLVEEPPERSAVLLVSDVPSGLLPTIRSRCRKIWLSPLKTEQVILLLEQYLPNLSEEDREPLARLAEGSPGRALLLAQSGGLELYREIVALIAQAPGIDPAALHRLADRLGGADAEGVWNLALDFLAGWFARLARSAGTGRTPTDTVLADEAEPMSRLAGDPGLERWVAVWEKIMHLRQVVHPLNLDRKQAILSVFGALEAAART